MKKDFDKKGEVILYQEPNGESRLSVRVQDETVWLSQKQMSQLFGKDISTINEHILNIFEEGELEKAPTVRKFRIVQKEGKRDVERNIEFYNLDVIISVGYRVKSKQGTQFRIWANKTLKEYLLKGYVLNEKLLEVDQKWQELNRVINFLKGKAELPQLDGQEKELLNLISSYSNSLRILDEYDKKQLSKGGKSKAIFEIDYSRAIKVVNEVKRELVLKSEASKDLFGNEIDSKLDAVIGAVNQTFAGKELYKTTEEKAANLLYLIAKGHVFSDGNKRLGSILFVYFLDKNNYLYNKNHERKINDNTMAALALLVANSDPNDKELIIDLIVNLLKA